MLCDVVYLNQRKYKMELLDIYSLLDTKDVDNVMIIRKSLSKYESVSFLDASQYRSIVGSTYLSRCFIYS